MSARHALSILWMSSVLACSKGQDEAAPRLVAAPEEQAAYDEAPPPGSPAPSAVAPSPKRAKMKREASNIRGKGGLGGELKLALGGSGSRGDGSERGEPLDQDEAEPEAGAARRWFPETFVFAPLVETDAAGQAKHQVRVPDRLTTWRVLALAHSREGAQAGAVTSFLGTLPVYLDPVLPPALSVGDEVEIPIQLVNTTDKPLGRSLTVRVEGGVLAAGGGPVALPPRESLLRTVRLVANQAGTLRFHAALSGEDAVVREVQVVPTGRPVRLEAGGTLAAPRTPKLMVPSELEAGTAALRLRVFPGALAVLRAELAAALGRGGLADDAYLLLLSGRAASLLQKLGVEPDLENLRRLRITATQRAMRHTRASAPEAALAFLPGAAAHEGDPVLTRLAQRLGQAAASAQRGDGTFLGASGWTVDRLLVTTAEGIRALAADTREPEAERRLVRARLLARGAVERMGARIEDPYTAATVLAAGLAEGTLQASLRKRVLEGLKARDDGTRWLVPTPVAERSDGTRPSEVEATAYAVLALLDAPDAKTVLPDLGAALLGSYRAGGFGDGRTNLVTLFAVLELFKEPLPARIVVQLLEGDRVLTQGVLEGAAQKDVLVLEAPLDARPTAPWRVVAEPPVPGLGFHLELRGYVPWKAEPERGLALAVETPSSARVGQTLEVTLRANAPGGAAFVIHHALPAGVMPDATSLERLVEAGSLSHFETRDGEVSLHVPERPQGRAAELRYRVIPTLAGRLRSTASRIEHGSSGEVRHLPPRDWQIMPITPAGR